MCVDLMYGSAIGLQILMDKTRDCQKIMYIHNGLHVAFIKEIVVNSPDIGKFREQFTERNVSLQQTRLAKNCKDLTYEGLVARHCHPPLKGW